MTAAFVRNIHNLLWSLSSFLFSVSHLSLIAALDFFSFSFFCVSACVFVFYNTTLLPSVNTIALRMFCGAK